MLNLSLYKFVTNTYRMLCLLLTIALVSWCIHEYKLDRDITEILLRKYHHHEDDIHPSITVCYMNPYQDHKFTKYYKNYSSGSASTFSAAYQSLINGDNVAKAELDKYSQMIEAIDYDDVTIGLRDIITQFHIKVTLTSESIDHFLYNVVNNANLVLNVNDSSITEPLIGFYQIDAYISTRQSNLKCFTFDVPYEKGIEIREIGMQLNASIFPWGLSPSQMYFTLTYPHQILRTSLGNRIKIPEPRNPQCYKFEIHVGSMEVFKRRNKEREECNEEWKNQDAKHLNYIMKTVGCQPKHWKVNSSNPYCTSAAQYDKINTELYRKDGFMPPCRSIETLAKITKGTHLRSFSSYSFLDLKVYLDEESFYKEIVLVPAYTVQSLIGNAGNYYHLLVNSFAILYNLHARTEDMFLSF